MVRMASLVIQGDTVFNLTTRLQNIPVDGTYTEYRNDYIHNICTQKMPTSYGNRPRTPEHIYIYIYHHLQGYQAVLPGAQLQPIAD